MRKKLSVFLAFMMVMSLFAAIPVCSEASAGHNDCVYDKTVASGYTLEFKTAAGEEPELLYGALTGSTGGNAVYLDGVAKMDFSFTGTANKEYMIYLLKPMEEKISDAPAYGNIAYVDRVTAGAGGAVACTIYPDSLSADGVYNVCVGEQGKSLKSVAKFRAGDFSGGETVRTEDLPMITAMESSNAEASGRVHTTDTDMKKCLASVTYVDTDFSSTIITPNDSAWSGVTATISAKTRGINTLNVTYNSKSTSISVALFETINSGMFTSNFAAADYNGVVHIPSIYSNTASGLTGADYTITYSVAQGKSGSLYSGRPCGAGEYSVMVSANASALSKYIDGSFVYTENFRINKSTQTGTVNMAGYTYGKTPSTPSVSGLTEETTNVKFYYSTSNTNSGGQLWSGIGSKTLQAGTYYMYAVVGETANYKSFTTAPVKFTVAEQSSSGGGGIFSFFTNFFQMIMNFFASLFSWGR